jgi:hypothetical protein
MGAHSYLPEGRASYTVTSDLPSRPYSLASSGGNGASDTYTGSTNGTGSAIGTFTVPNIDQLWYVNATVDGSQGHASCSTQFYSEGS